MHIQYDWEKKMVSSAHLRFGISHLALLGGLFAVSGAGTAVAQDQPGAGTALVPEEIIVTGTRIKGNPDVASANPITVVGQVELARSNDISIQDVLAKIPSVGTQGSNAQESSNFGANGFQNIDLRNLQPQRTLVLVDGERFVSSANSGAFSAVDLNNIPVDLIDHIEILRDGASPVYGSDAVAGVVNFVLKHDFNGLQTSFNIGTSNEGDGTQYSFSTLMGLSNDRGGIILDLGYNHVDPVYQRDRFWSRNVNGSANSGYFPQGHFTNDDPTAVPFDHLGNNHGGFGPAPVGSYDTTQIPNLISGYERKTANMLGHYDLNPDSTDFPIKFVGSFMFTDRESVGLANPDPQFALTTARALGIKTLPPGEIIDAAFRSPQIGNRLYTTDVDTYRLTAGLEGQLFGKFDWDLKYNNGVSDGQAISGNLVNMGVLVPASGVYTAANLNNLSPAAIQSLRLSPVDNLRTQEDEWSADVSGPAFSLPYGDVTFAVGGDYRSESLIDRPDSAEVLGLVDQGGLPTSGSYNLWEGYAEVKIPILKDLPFAKDLSIDAAGRYSNYSNFGDAETYKVTLNYAPVSDIRFRGTISTGFRAPTIQELYLANTQSFNGVSDPCDTKASSGSLFSTSKGLTHSIVAANCARQLSAAGVNPATFTATGNAQQILGIEGGNPNLTPETTRNLTVGTVITPEIIPNLQITIDYWRIKLDNQIIETPDAQTALDACYSSVNLSNPECATIGPRVRTPISAQLTRGGISQQVLNSLNEGYIDTSGIDFGLDYSYAMDNFGLPELGRLIFSHQSTLTRAYQASDQTGKVQNYLGTILPTTLEGGGYPEYQARMSLGLQTDSWSFTWTTRFIQGLQRYTNSSQPGPVPGVLGDFTPDVWYHDIAATYTLGQADFVVGIDNLFDRTPPYFADAVGRTNSNPYLYDYMGRYFYFKATYRFGEGDAGPISHEAPYTPPPAVAAAPSVPHSYLVFFDFNKSDLTPQAVSIVNQAASNAAPAHVTQLTVTGHTDTVGSDAYNMRLSRRRAESVASQLEKDGIASSEIEIVAKGKRDLLVPTADGVKEPQNRRVQIVYSGGPTS